VNRAVLALTLGLATPCGAQADSTASLRWCWRGKPAPKCTSFWVTELGLDANRWSTQTVVTEDFGGGNVYRYAQRDFDSRLAWTIGPMFNRGPRTAIGGTVSISPLDNGYRAALEARRRWWKTGDLGLDLSVGGIRMGLPRGAGGAYRDGYGLTAGALLVGGDLINVNGRVDLLVTGGRSRAGASVGLAGGSYIALAGTVALGLLIFAIISAGPLD
jgi:hypothetical protein